MKKNSNSSSALNKTPLYSFLTVNQKTLWSAALIFFAFSMHGLAQNRLFEEGTNSEGGSSNTYNYCMPNVSTSNAHITYIQLGNPVNTPSFLSNSTGNDGYSFYPNLSTQDFTSYQIDFNPESDGQIKYYTMFVDYNEDGEFSGIDELEVSGFTFGTSVSGEIEIPADAVTAEFLRIRFIVSGSPVTDPCGQIYGEVEDYEIPFNSGGVWPDSNVQPNSITASPITGGSNGRTIEIQGDCAPVNGSFSFELSMINDFGGANTAPGIPGNECMVTNTAYDIVASLDVLGSNGPLGGCRFESDSYLDLMENQAGVLTIPVEGGSSCFTYGVNQLVLTVEWKEMDAATCTPVACPDCILTDTVEVFIGCPEDGLVRSRNQSEETNEQVTIHTKELNAYPNPFTERFSLAYTLETEEEISVSLINNLGQEVARLINGEVQARGTHKLEVNASGYSPGVYYAVIYSGNQSEILKMIKTGL